MAEGSGRREVELSPLKGHGVASRGFCVHVKTKKKKLSRGTPEAQSRLCECRASFLMTFAMGGVPHSGPQQ